MDLKAISELKGLTFVIPYQQRGYKWTPDNVKVLLDDFNSFIDSKKTLYCLQPIAIAKCTDSYRFVVIDGQQRLTTLYLIWKYLQLNDTYKFEFERDDDDERKDFLENISTIEEINDNKIDFFYISRAYLAIKEWFEADKANEKKIKELLLAPKDKPSVQVLWYEVEEKKEHEAFRDINSGKIQLSNSDLIKALLLNNTNNFENRQQIAAQFELMERQLAEDRFWYMLQRKDIEPLKGQSRIDLLFNMEANIKNEDYQIDSRKSFFLFSNYSTEKLLIMWKNIREKYQRLRDLFEDPYTFHYIGFLIYCGHELNDIVNEYSSRPKTEFRSYLKTEIKKQMFHNRLEEYSYEDSKVALRRLFVLHNIETLLYRYEDLSSHKALRFSFENFPFELLYTQTWNIEHIASHTDNDLKKQKDREDWIKSVTTDFESLFNDDKLKILKQEAEADLNNDENFNQLYEYIIKKANDNPIENEEDKNGIGNLVLLDEHTNKSFHNSLFPRKRRIVIMASGLRNKKDPQENVEPVYVPICTQQVYTKSYNKQSNVNLNCWGQDDYDAYLSGMREKLKFYFDTNQGE